MPRITKRVVDTAEPAERDRFVWDETLHGFGLKVTRGGRKVYIVQYRSGGRGTPTRRITIGTHGGPWTAEQARKEAERILGLVKTGHDPADERARRRDRLTVKQLVERFLDQHVGVRNKHRTADEYRRLFDRCIIPAFGRKPVDEVQRRDVMRLHHGMRETPYQANRVLAVLSKLFNWAEQQGERPDGTNPCRHVEKFKERARSRFLAPSELSALAKALRVCDDQNVIPPAASAAIRLLIFTGARVSEILTLQWSFLDSENGIAHLPDSKTGSKRIYLNPPALEVLNNLPRIEGNPYCIAGRKKGARLINLQKPWRLVRSKAGLDDVRLHDLRHSHASVGAAAGLSLPMIGALLGHSEPQTTARYAHLADDPLKLASNDIGRRIKAAMTGEDASVVPLRKS